MIGTDEANSPKVFYDMTLKFYSPNSLTWPILSLRFPGRPHVVAARWQPTRGSAFNTDCKMHEYLGTQRVERHGS